MGCKAFGSSLLLILAAVAALSATAVSTATIVSASTSSVMLPLAPSSTETWRVVTNTAFRAGEEFHYVVKWGIIKGGTSSLIVKAEEPMKDRQAYHIQSEANSAGVVDTFYKTHDLNETWLDTHSLATLRYEKHIREGRYKVEQSVDIDQINHRYQDYSQRLDKGTTFFVEGPVPADVMDVLGSLYYVRTLPLTVGESYTFDIYDNKKIWPMEVKMLKRETVKVPAGKFDCIKVEPILREPGIFVAKGKRLQVWMTADERRIPVMMRSEVAIGHVSAELVSYTQPGAPVVPTP